MCDSQLVSEQMTLNLYTVSTRLIATHRIVTALE